MWFKKEKELDPIFDRFSENETLLDYAHRVGCSSTALNPNDYFCNSFGSIEPKRVYSCDDISIFDGIYDEHTATECKGCGAIKENNKCNYCGS